MPRQLNRLSAVAVSRAKAKGVYHDGGGLYLQVTPAGNKSWIFRYMLNGRAREMGLGPVHRSPWPKLEYERPNAYASMASIPLMLGNASAESRLSRKPSR